MVKKQKLNYVDFIPGINIQWKITKDNLVEIIVENKGFYNVVARRLLKKPRFSYVQLDSYGSYVWRQIDGKRNIYEIGARLEKEHSKAGEMLYERLSMFFNILEKKKFIVFMEEDK